MANILTTPNLWKANSSTEIAPLNTTVSTIQGNTGGTIIKGGTATGDNLDLYANSSSYVQTNTGRIKCHERMTFPDNQTFTASFGIDSMINFSGTLSDGGTAVMMFPSVYDTRTISYGTSQVASIPATFWANVAVKPTFDPSDTLTYWYGFISQNYYSGGAGSTSPSTVNFGGFNATPQLAKGSAATSVSVTNLIGYTTWGSPIFGSNDIPTSTSVTNVYHYKCKEPIQSGGSSTNQIGLYIPSLTISTNNYGIYSDLASSSSRYFIYDAGGAESYFKGNMSLGGSLNSVSYEDSEIYYEDDLIFYHSIL